MSTSCDSEISEMGDCGKPQGDRGDQGGCWFRDSGDVYLAQLNGVVQKFVKP
jgi:hypothetical protein